MESNETLVLDPIGEIKEDDFIKNLKQETEKDKLPPPPQSAPQSEKTKKERDPADDDPADDDDLDELSNPALVSDIIVETFDLIHNIAMQALSGEPNQELWKVPAQGKARIKKATQKLIQKINWNLHPGFALVLLILVAYGPTTVKAAGVKKMKLREERIKNGEEEKSDVEVKRGPGRPPGPVKNKK